jgi:DNA-directed RNA polymerase specialized sigma subunit
MSYHSESTIIDLYRKEIYRIGWKIQYKSKVIYTRESPSEFDLFSCNDFTSDSDRKVTLHQLVNSLSSNNEKIIIYELYINDKTESLVAQEMNISQQAVSKWKKKAIKSLYQRASFWNY